MIRLSGSCLAALYSINTCPDLRPNPRVSAPSFVAAANTVSVGANVVCGSERKSTTNTANDIPARHRQRLARARESAASDRE